MLYKDLTVWQKSMDLGIEIYNLSKKFPNDEMFGLVNQIRRAAISIASNIAEGQGRATPKEYLYFLSIARGSNAEVDTQLQFAIRLGYISAEEAKNAIELIKTTAKLINATMTSVKSKLQK